MGFKWGSLIWGFQCPQLGKRTLDSAGSSLDSASMEDPLNMMAPLKGGLTIIAPAKLCLGWSPSHPLPAPCDTSFGVIRGRS